MGAVYIVEGVAGSGKDTLVSQIVESLRPYENRVLVFSEEAVLASWLHYFVPGIHELRLQLTQRLIEHVKLTLARDADAVFVFNRFHVSHAVWRAELGADKGLEEQHERLVAEMAHLPLKIFQAVIQEDEANSRSSHVERREVAWQRFLEERVRFAGTANAGETFFAQQGRMTSVIEADGLPFMQVRVEPNKPLDTATLLSPR